MAKNLGNPAFVLITTMLLLAAGAFTLGVSAAKVYLQKLPVEPPFAVASMPAQSDSWERLGEVCHEYLHKGSLVYIEGRLKTDKYQAESGENRYFTKVVLQQMQMLDKKEEKNVIEELPAEYEAE